MVPSPIEVQARNISETLRGNGLPTPAQLDQLQTSLNAPGTLSDTAKTQLGHLRFELQDFQTRVTTSAPETASVRDTMRNLEMRINSLGIAAQRQELMNQITDGALSSLEGTRKAITEFNTKELVESTQKIGSGLIQDVSTTVSDAFTNRTPGSLARLGVVGVGLYATYRLLRSLFSRASSAVSSAASATTSWFSRIATFGAGFLAGTFLGPSAARAMGFEVPQIATKEQAEKKAKEEVVKKGEEEEKKKVSDAEEKIRKEQVTKILNDIPVGGTIDFTDPRLGGTDLNNGVDLLQLVGRTVTLNGQPVGFERVSGGLLGSYYILNIGGRRMTMNSTGLLSVNVGRLLSSSRKVTINGATYLRNQGPIGDPIYIPETSLTAVLNSMTTVPPPALPAERDFETYTKRIDTVTDATDIVVDGIRYKREMKRIRFQAV